VSTHSFFEMPNLIKSYLPIRLTLPSIPQTSSVIESIDTYFYIKKHVSNSANNSRTLFLANAPFYPNVRTNLLLTCLFEKYGEVEKVLVTSNPRKLSPAGCGENDGDVTLQKLFEKEIENLGEGRVINNGIGLNENDWYNQGRFAHITFSSSKEMKKALALLSGTQKKKKVQSTDVGHVIIGKLELQELQDTSIGLFEKEKAKFVTDSNGNHSVTGSRGDSKEQKSSGSKIAKLAQLHRDSIPPRAFLKDIADKIVLKYEQDEEVAQKRLLETKGKADEDGFITVSRSAAVGDKVFMEESVGNTGMKRGRRRTRSTKQKAFKGNDELKDFYRFQLKAEKKRNVEELKNRFEEDLKRVKRMKEEKMYRPF